MGFIISQTNMVRNGEACVTLRMVQDDGVLPRMHPILHFWSRIYMVITIKTYNI